MFCSVPKVFFPRWEGFFFLVLCTTHLPRMRNLVPTFAHPPPPTRSAAAGHTNAGGNPLLPMATAGRTSTGGNTPAPLSAQHSRRRSCRRRRRSSDKFTTRLAEWPPPAVQAPAATHLRPSPLDAPAAGLSNAGGGAVARACLRWPPLPPTRRAAAGHTDAGGNPPRPIAAAGRTNAGGDTPAPLSARNVRRRSCQRRRRSSSTCTPPLPAAPRNMQSRRRPYRRRRQPASPNVRRRPYRHRRRHTSAPPHPTRPPPVLPMPAAAHKHVHASLARRPCQNAEPPPAIPTPAATHQRPSPPDTSAAGLSDAGTD